MGKITAVAKLEHKAPKQESEETNLVFYADYSDERNKEWAKYTPALSLNMTVLNSVADGFEQGASYLLTFEKRD